MGEGGWDGGNWVLQPFFHSFFSISSKFGSEGLAPPLFVFLAIFFLLFFLFPFLVSTQQRILINVIKLNIHYDNSYFHFFFLFNFVPFYPTVLQLLTKTFTLQTKRITQITNYKTYNFYPYILILITRHKNTTSILV